MAALIVFAIVMAMLVGVGWYRRCRAHWSAAPDAAGGSEAAPVPSTRAENS